jgi:hypothetical protein
MAVHTYLKVNEELSAASASDPDENACYSKSKVCSNNIS